MDNGTFYGFGALTYPNGTTITNLFLNGTKKSTVKYEFSDKMPAGPYCEGPDRRYLHFFKNFGYTTFFYG